MKLSPSSPSKFVTVNPGTYVATCYRVIDLGIQKTTFKEQVKHTHQVLIGWETPTETLEDGRPFVVNQTYTVSTSEKGKLMQLLNAWAGKKLTDEDLKKFTFKSLLGRAGLINLVGSTGKDGRVYSNVSSISPLVKGMEAHKLVNKAEYFSFEDSSLDEFLLLNVRIQDRIKSAENWDVLEKRLKDNSKEEF